jgi:hypothetical protein
LFVVIISPFTNHFTAGVIIEFQAEIIVGTIPKSNIKIVERGIHLIPLTHKYMIDHFPGSIYLFILKKMGVAIIDFRVCMTSIEIAHFVLIH